MKKLLTGIVCLFFTATALADDQVTVTDMTQLRWQSDPTGRIYIRNLSQFDATFLGCCYNFYVDTTTADGKAKWSAILTTILTGGSLYFFVANKTVPGPVTYIGN